MVFYAALDPSCSTTADTEYAIDALLAAGFSPDQQVLELPTGIQVYLCLPRQSNLADGKCLQPTRGCRSLRP